MADKMPDGLFLPREGVFQPPGRIGYFFSAFFDPVFTKVPQSSLISLDNHFQRVCFGDGY
jgi:hypothetical protein